MREVVPGVWQLSSMPRQLMNAYLAGGVLFDALTRGARKKVLRELAGQPLKLVALTHCHPDHQGAAKEVCVQFNVPLACHEADVPAMEGREQMVPRNFILKVAQRRFAGPPHPVGRVLHDGDEVEGFRVVHAPGHTPGHVIYFRESDGLAIAGDVLRNVRYLTTLPRLGEPPGFFSADPVQNLRSVQILAGLRPKVVCFGHGQPLRDPDKLQRFAEKLLKKA
jgi:glyoxylase-like metal-dependent hydrolase (beta-lactamase superfamily II)